MTGGAGLSLEPLRSALRPATERAVGKQEAPPSSIRECPGRGAVSARCGGEAGSGLCLTVIGGAGPAVGEAAPVSEDRVTLSAELGPLEPDECRAVKLVTEVDQVISGNGPRAAWLRVPGGWAVAGWPCENSGRGLKHRGPQYFLRRTRPSGQSGANNLRKYLDSKILVLKVTALDRR